MASPHARFGRRALRSARLPSNATRLHPKRTRNSPCSQSIRSRLVVSNCVRAPVSGSRLVETAVRVDSWMAAVVGRVGVFMASMFSLPIFPVHVQLLRSRTGALLTHCAAAQITCLVAALSWLFALARPTRFCARKSLAAHHTSSAPSMRWRSPPSPARPARPTATTMPPTWPMNAVGASSLCRTSALALAAQWPRYQSWCWRPPTSPAL